MVEVDVGCNPIVLHSVASTKGRVGNEKEDGVATICKGREVSECNNSVAVERKGRFGNRGGMEDCCFSNRESNTIFTVGADAEVLMGAHTGG